MATITQKKHEVVDACDIAKEVRKAQDRFAALPPEDVKCFVVIAARSLPADEVTDKGDHETFIQIGGSYRDQVYMVTRLTTAVLDSTPGEPEPR